MIANLICAGLAGVLVPNRFAPHGHRPSTGRRCDANDDYRCGGNIRISGPRDLDAVVMKKLKNEKELVKKAIAEGMKYGEARGVVEFEATDFCCLKN